MASKSTQNKGRKKTTGNKSTKGKKTNQIDTTKDEIIILTLLAISIIILISNFGLAGFIGNYVASINFGLWGMLGHIFPFALFIGATYFYAYRKHKKVYIKTLSAISIFVSISTLMEICMRSFREKDTLIVAYRYAAENRSGGGFVGGAVTRILYPALGFVGSIVILTIIIIIGFVIITEKSILNVVKNQGERAMEGAMEQREINNSNRHIKREEAKVRKEELRAKREIENELRLEELEKRRSNIPVRGVTFDTDLSQVQSKGEDIKVEEMDNFDITANQKNENKKRKMDEVETFHAQYNEVPKHSLWDDVTEEMENIELAPVEEEPIKVREMSHQAYEVKPTVVEEVVEDVVEEVIEEVVNEVVEKVVDEDKMVNENIEPIINTNIEESNYKLPPLDLLKKGPVKGSDGEQELRETALKLEDTLNSFGVKVKVTQYSKGPSVTRYELQPEKGVKVSKIVGLADDIKLNLAAADIRIEAPIPGKAAVGIEVPNKENSVVALRSLLESDEFKNHGSNIAFAAGKDIGGQAVVTDIGKMPHVLIAGSTGSGKSVCINTLIMSILYKANPEDVKLIMIDPKVVELSVYNGIPHLLIPVVTDPKKAAGALHWAVAEMTKRYQLFAEYNVRDLSGFNEKVKNIEDIEDETKPEKMPQIVVIVDELADLMMVAPGDVEEAICRLAQLARAAGIHLILATQRPSVNVITGLIKANMPSRIAFAVSSGVDSRTIIDMNGAEKLLGKGDMLFYPAGYPKPSRVQGAFVSDKEVHDVVQYLIEQQGETTYNEEIQKEVSSSAVNVGAMGGGASSDELDSYFIDAGKFIIEKDKASIGMIQRTFKVGFNRAARIMDQLAQAGVVGEEEGTKPRKILMSISEFELYIDECV